MIAVLQAYKDKKRVQCRLRDTVDEWKDILFIGEESPTGNTCIGTSWNTFLYDYRIKPEPHYRPFESAEEVMEAIKEHGDWIKWKKNDAWNHRILSYSTSKIRYSDGDIDMTTMFDEYTFADGTPFGKLVEE